MRCLYLTLAPFPPPPLQLLSKFPSTTIVLDTTGGAWPTPEIAVNFTVAKALNRTTSLAFQEGPRLAAGFLADWIVSQRLFVMYLPDSCVPFTSDNAVVKAVVAAAPWPRPVRVYGYNRCVLCAVLCVRVVCCAVMCVCVLYVCCVFVVKMG